MVNAETYACNFPKAESFLVKFENVSRLANKKNNIEGFFRMRSQLSLLQGKAGESNEIDTALLQQTKMGGLPLIMSQTRALERQVISGTLVNDEKTENASAELINKHLEWFKNSDRILKTGPYVFIPLCFHIDQVAAMVEFDFKKYETMFENSLKILEQTARIWYSLNGPIALFKVRFELARNGWNVKQSKQTKELDEKLKSQLKKSLEEALPNVSNFPWMNSQILFALGRKEEALSVFNHLQFHPLFKLRFPSFQESNAEISNRTPSSTTESATTTTNQDKNQGPTSNVSTTIITTNANTTTKS